jgi:anti-sigma factor RsiW
MTDFEKQLAALAPRGPTPDLRARLRADRAAAESAPSLLRRLLPAAALGAIAVVGLWSALFTAKAPSAPRVSFEHITGRSESGLLYRDGAPPLRITRVTSVVCIAWQDPRTNREIVRLEPHCEITLSPIEIQ